MYGSNYKQVASKYLTSVLFSAFMAFGQSVFAQEESTSASTGGGSVQDSEVLVMLETDAGEIALQLFPEYAPKTVENFLQYVDSGFYNGTIFHRVIKDFMVQGGGLTFDYLEKETLDPVVNESNNGLRNLPGTVAMARFSDPNSANSQFFINLRANPHLDASATQPGYTVFGRVVEGRNAVFAIVDEPQGLIRKYPNAPNTPVRILKSYRISPDDLEAISAKKAAEEQKTKAQ
ncbi:peptidylprolyl isomerase [Sessilibacter sp. MAH1]